MNWLMGAHACSSVHCSTVLALLDPVFVTARLGRGCSSDGGCRSLQGKDPMEKKMFMSFADTKEPIFLKNMYILRSSCYKKKLSSKITFKF